MPIGNCILTNNILIKKYIFKNKYSEKSGMVLHFAKSLNVWLNRR